MPPLPPSMPTPPSPPTSGPMPSQKNTLTYILLASTVLLIAGLVGIYLKLDQSTRESQRLTAEITSLKSQVSALETAAVKAEKTTPPVQEGPLVYGDLGSSVSVTMQSIDFPYSVTDLVNRSVECGTNKSAADFTPLIAKYSNAKGWRYTFMYTQASQDPKNMVVAVFPNLANYASLEEFKKDFDFCAGGGQDYPTLVNGSYIAFESSCGTGYSDTSGLPIGCSRVKEIIEPSIRLSGQPLATWKTYTRGDYTFEYPAALTPKATEPPEIGGTAAEFVDRDGKAAFTFMCPPPGRGFEAWNFTSKNRTFSTKNKEYRVDLNLGTPTAEAGDIGNLNMISIGRINEGDTPGLQKDEATKNNCLLISGSDTTASLYRHIYESIK